MFKKTIAAAVALCVFAAMPMYAAAQDNSTQSTTTLNWQDPDVFKNMGLPEGGYGTAIYHALKDSDHRGFIDWLNGFTPEQRKMIIRSMYIYGTTPDMMTFSVATKPEEALPVFVKGLTTADQPVFTNFWDNMKPDQQKDFIMFSKDIYPLTPVVDTMPATTVVVTPSPVQGVDYFSTMMSPYNDYGQTIYTAIPVSDQPGFVNWIGGFTPDQRVMVVRTLHYYSVAPNMTPFTADTTPVVAMPVFTTVLMPEDRDSFTSFWNSMTPDQQASFITYARDVYPSSMTTTTTTTTTTMPMTDSSGGAAQPFGVTLAAAFVGYLPEAEHTAYNAIASDTPTSELGGLNTVLSKLTPEQAGMVVHALASINSMGKGGAAPKQGMSDMNTKALYLSQLPDANKSDFETMWNALDDQQRSSLEQLARDAYNGGMNDTGMSTNTGS